MPSPDVILAAFYGAVLHHVDLATQQRAEFLLHLDDMPANDRDGKEPVPTIERVEQHSDVTAERVIGDGAYLSGNNLAACAAHPQRPIDLLGPLNRPADPEVASPRFR